MKWLALALIVVSIVLAIRPPESKTFIVFVIQMVTSLACGTIGCAILLVLLFMAL